MKKIILGTVLVVALGFAFGTDAHAAGTDVLTPTNASLLKQSLDVVDTFMNQLGVRVSAKDPAVLNATPQVNAVLNSVSASLRGINSTLAALDANARALAQSESPAQQQVVYGASPAQAAEPTRVIAGSAPSEPVSGVVVKPAPASPAPVNPEVAVVATHFNLKNLVWPAIAILVIFGAVWSLRARKTQDDKEAIELGSLDHAWDPVV